MDTMDTAKAYRIDTARSADADADEPSQAPTAPNGLDAVPKGACLETNVVIC
jgi:hypothetical protein